MAQLICRRTDHRHAATDPGVYRAGDVVAVLADGVHPGAKIVDENGKVANQKFFIVSVPGPASDYRDLIARDTEPVVVKDRTGSDVVYQQVVGRRREQINVGAMNAAHRTAIEEGRAVVLPGKAALAPLRRTRANGRN